MGQVMRPHYCNGVSGSDYRLRLRKSQYLLFSLAISVAIVVGSGQPSLGAQPSDARTLRLIRSLLENKDGLPFDVRSKADQLGRYYKETSARLLWIRTDRAGELLKAIGELSESQLIDSTGSLRRLQRMEQARMSLDASFLALVELTFSAHYLRLASDLRLGRTHLYPRQLHRRTLDRIIFPEIALGLLERNESLQQILDRLQPQLVDYRSILAKYLDYLRIQKSGGWGRVPKGADLKKGDRGPRVIRLRRRLAITGELAPEDIEPEFFDENLSLAVRRFQRRHNISATGSANRRTLLAMNIPVQSRINQLLANLERWRWFEDLETADVWIVNVALPRLFVRQSKGPQKTLKIKASSACQQYAAFSSTVDHVVVKPTFTFEKKHALKYVLPALKLKTNKLDPSLIIIADASQIQTKRVNWKEYNEGHFPFTVVQASGQTNLLGSFQIPIKDDSQVSLHGEPSVRPELPLPKKLWPACVALKAGRDEIDGLLSQILSVATKVTNLPDSTASSYRVEFRRPIPIIFVYATVWLGAEGELVFGADPLGLDAKLVKLLSRGGNRVGTRG